MNNSNKTIIIAEGGVNHNGKIELALKMVEKAALAGADFIKFQSFTSAKLTTNLAPKTQYQIENSNPNQNQLDMLSQLELTSKEFKILFKCCKDNNINFLSTAFDNENLDMLLDLGMSFIKIPSGEITNIPFLRYISKKRIPIILSTGMSDIHEINIAINELTKNGINRTNLTILHCNSEYPTPYEDVNLLAMTEMRQKLNINVGYSDHTLGLDVPIAAVALGAKIIEKHITLDNNLNGPDHRASLHVKDLPLLVKSIRNIEKALGNSVKKVTPSEAKNLILVRRSIVAKKAIKKGTIFTSENITTKRPGNGICSSRWDEVIGQKAIKDYLFDEKINQ